MMMMNTFLEVVDLLGSERRSVSLQFALQSQSNLLVRLAVMTSSASRADWARSFATTTRARFCTTSPSMVTRNILDCDQSKVLLAHYFPLIDARVFEISLI